MVARYSSVAVTLHWLIAILIVANVVLAWVWPTVPDDQVLALADTHKAIGVTVLGLVVLRLLWRFGHRPPEQPAARRRWERVLSRLVHGLLYLVAVGLPLTGWIMQSAWDSAAQYPLTWFGLFDWPQIGAIESLDAGLRDDIHEMSEEAHEIAANALYGLVFLHVAGALKHQFLDREKELQRMWYG